MAAAEEPGQKPATEDTRPFVAPCRRLDPGAGLRWLRLGWTDLRAAPGISLAYGGLIVLLSWVVVLAAWRLGGFVLVMAALTGFIFVAPLLATGMYTVSRDRLDGRTPTLAASFAGMRRALGNALVFALMLMVISLVWIRAGSMVHIFFPAGQEGDWLLLARFLAIGSAIGSIFAAIVFAAAAFSLPMVADRDVDMVTAALSSVNAVLRNKPAMLVWALLIVALTALGFATALLGLALVMPWLGYAAFHGYREALQAEDWPRHP
jgi:uncharacterized membrane protein